MTTKHDSFDSSPNDAFVQSQCDARNLGIPQPKGKLILLYFTFGGQSHALHGVGYVNGDFQDPSAPIFRNDYPTGVELWDGDFAGYSDRRSRWNTQRSEMRSGILHSQVYIPWTGTWHSLPLRPWSRQDDLSGWPVMQRRVNAETELGYLEELTLQLVDPADLIYSITLVHDGSIVSPYPQDVHHPWLWHHPWVEWARETYLNRVEHPIPGWPLHGIQAYGIPVGGATGGPLRDLHRWLALGNELIGRGSW